MPSNAAEVTNLPIDRHPLAYRDVVLFLIARFTTVAAGAMQAVAVGWQVFDLTGRPLDLGLVGLVQFTPGLLLCLVTGHVADRFDRRLIAICCLVLEIIAAAMLMTMSLAHAASEGGIMASVFLFGTARAFERPSTAALLPNLLPTSVFPRAVAWSSSANQSGIVLGPALGGVLYAAAPGLIYGVEATILLSGLVAIACLSFRGMPQAKESGMRALMGGLSYIWHRPIILGAISLDLFAVLLGGATALLPVFGKEILHVGPEGVGLLRAAPAFGAVLTALSLAQKPIRRSAGRLMFTAVIVFGLATLTFAFSRSMPLSLICLAILGSADAVSVQVRQTLVQVSTPDEMRGRVGAVNYLFVGTSNELGEFESGVTADWFGPVGSVVLGGVGTLFVVGLWIWTFPQLWRYDNRRLPT